MQAIGWIVGLRVLRYGRPSRRNPNSPLLLVANHTSWLDILALAGGANSAFVAKGDLGSHRVLKWLCDQNDTLFVAREKRGSVNRQISSLRAALARRVMTIFPEGTTSDGTALLPFKSALFSAVEGVGNDVTVQPVALAYQGAHDIAWWGDEPGSANVLRILARTRPILLDIQFLPPLEGNELADRKAMASVTQRRIASALALPTLSESPPIA